MSVESANGSVTEPVSADRFAREGLAVLHRLTESARADVHAAAALIADCVRADGVVQAFGTGHSQAMVLELAGRAGGFVPTNRIQMADLVLFGGDHPSGLDDPLLEREPGIAVRLYELADPRPQDLFVVISNSGVNSVIVEMALHAKERGHRVLALTSLAHTASVPATHPSGKKLADLADVVLDNAAPRGDALLELPTGGAVCALSTLTGVMLVQMTVAEAAAQLLASGDRPRSTSPPTCLASSSATWHWKSGTPDGSGVPPADHPRMSRTPVRASARPPADGRPSSAAPRRCRTRCRPAPAGSRRPS